MGKFEADFTGLQIHAIRHHCSNSNLLGDFEHLARFALVFIIGKMNMSVDILQSVIATYPAEMDCKSIKHIQLASDSNHERL